MLDKSVKTIENLGSLVKGDVQNAKGLLEFLRDSYNSSSVEALSTHDFSKVQDSLKDALSSIDALALLDLGEKLKVPAELLAWIVEFSQNSATTSQRLAAKAFAQIDVLRVHEGKVEIDIQITLLNQLKDYPLLVELVVGKHKIQLNQTGEEAGHYIFDQAFAQSAYFSHSFGVDLVSGTGSIKVQLTDPQGSTRNAAITYRPASHLVNLRFQSWTKSGITFMGKRKSITFQKASLAKRAVLELLYTMVMALETLKHSGLKVALGFVFIRAAYWISYPVLHNREIWVTHDKMYSALDSGEYFYWYVQNHSGGKVHPFYAINKSAKDVPRLKKLGAKLIHPRTIKHYLYYLHANVYVTTASGSDVYNGFTGRASRRFRDLIDGRVLCIQHGLIVQGVYRTMHRGRAGIERIYCSSEVEVSNLSNPKFGYKREQLPKSGFARFDGLSSNRTNTIMISPTWRRELTGPSVGLANPRKANSAFAKTAFFKVYSDVLLNEKLLTSVSAAGYKLQFVLHPLLAGSADVMRSALAEEAEKQNISNLVSSTIEVVGAGLEKSFDTLIRECASLVTDFSGVQFDVAYMRKPVIYFHSEEVPAQYDNSPMDFEKVGFGPVTETPSQLRDAIIAELKAETSSFNKYADRVDAFFENVDHNNCERIFKDAYEFTR